MAFFFINKQFIKYQIWFETCIFFTGNVYIPVLNKYNKLLLNNN